MTLDLYPFPANDFDEIMPVLRVENRAVLKKLEYHTSIIEYFSICFQNCGRCVVPLNIINENIDMVCDCERWDVSSEDQLARIISIVAMGQALHAAEIVRTLIPADPAFESINSFNAARDQLQIHGTTDEQRNTSRWHRDGFIFEVISWVAIQKTASAKSLMKTPHVKATTQGLDGLLLEVTSSPPEIQRATICEDKCSENPRETFRDKVLPVFKRHHDGKREPELVAEAASLLAQLGLGGTEATKAASRVVDLNARRYRAALAVETAHDSLVERKKLFKSFNDLLGTNQSQRLAATFIVEGKLREYFDSLATKAISFLDMWEKKVTHV